MADITPELKKIHQEETDSESSFSESTQFKIGASINALVGNGPEKIGVTAKSILTEAEFQATRGYGWVLMRGQDITGSDLHALSGITTLPDFVGTAAFMRQASSQSNIGVYQVDTNKSHHHLMAADSGASSSVISGSSALARSSSVTTNPESYLLIGVNTPATLGRSSLAGSYGRPNNFSVNIFIKING